VQTSVHLFRIFHMLRSFGKRTSPIDGYFFQHMTKGTTVYIVVLTPIK
jgi:hypothetical protein